MVDRHFRAAVPSFYPLFAVHDNSIAHIDRMSDRSGDPLVQESLYPTVDYLQAGIVMVNTVVFSGNKPAIFNDRRFIAVRMDSHKIESVIVIIRKNAISAWDINHRYV
ncbi:hypothetical protein ES708_04148 [subsurface metagenome]